MTRPGEERSARQARGVHLTPADVVADIDVLAKHAAQIAPGKKDRARASAADKWTFLTKVGAVAGHYTGGRDPTESLFS